MMIPKVKEEFAKLLGDIGRDFDERPITKEESEDLITHLFELVCDPKTSENLASFYIGCIEAIKPFIHYQ